MTALDDRAAALDGAWPDEASLRHVLGRMADVEARVTQLVATRRAADPDPDDPYRGLYVSDAHVDQLLGGVQVRTLPAATHEEVETRADADEAAGAVLRLRSLARRHGLDAIDVDLLLLAAAPAVDSRFERLYGYLNDDVTRRRVTVGLALELLGLPTTSGRARARLGPAGPLVAGGLVAVEGDAARGLLTREVTIPDRVVAHLLGADDVDAVVQPLLVQTPPVSLPDVDRLATVLSPAAGGQLAAAAPLLHLVDRVGTASTAVAAAAAEVALGQPALVVDLDRLPNHDEVAASVDALLREARLTGRVIVAGPVEVLAGLDRRATRRLVDAPVPRVLIGAGAWDTTWGDAVPLSLPGPLPTADDRQQLWRSAIQRAVAERGGERSPDAGLDPAAATVAFRLSPDQIDRAAWTAAVAAAADGRPLTDEDLRMGARAQNALGLEHLARRIEPRSGWDDLVVGRRVKESLRELAARSRHRDVVLREWGIGRRTGGGRGVTGLFAGPSGTGKTLAAEVVAGDLGLDLYVIDLSTVIDKYIGETEKNLDRVFDQADRVNGILLFDEADALFGKRSEVSDAHDRHANVEVAYLLQRMEAFDGIALLTTNLRSNIDEAFTRRFDTIVEFTEPDADDRLALWRLNLVDRVPLADDVDLDWLAERFRLTGGEIRNIAVSAAYLAADRARSVGMDELVAATAAEHRKLGRLVVAADFDPYDADLVEPPTDPTPA